MYESFAEVYDRLMDDFDYPAWAEYYLALFRTAGVSPAAVCDCGCGTGALSVPFAEKGLRVTGVDLSESMLRRAAERARRAGVEIPFICQDMRALRLHRPVDAIVAGCDGVNYLTDEDSVRAFFARAFSAVRPGGALAFDVSSANKLRAMDGQVYFEDRDDVTYLWRNALEGRVLRMELTFFVRKPGGLYRRFDETHFQRAHEIKELLLWLGEAGFENARVYGDRTLTPPAPAEKRWHFVARRPETKEC